MKEEEEIEIFNLVKDLSIFKDQEKMKIKEMINRQDKTTLELLSTFRRDGDVLGLYERIKENGFLGRKIIFEIQEEPKVEKMELDISRLERLLIDIPILRIDYIVSLNNLFGMIYVNVLQVQQIFFVILKNFGNF